MVRKPLKIYDPVTGKRYSVPAMIEKLGVRALAKKYRVSESTVLKWKYGIHHPAKRTITKSMKELF